MQMQYFWIAAAVIMLLLDLWAINSIARSENASASKVLWATLIVLVPLVGLAIWGVAGPRGVTKGPTSPEHSKG